MQRGRLFSLTYSFAFCICCLAHSATSKIQLESLHAASNYLQVSLSHSTGSARALTMTSAVNPSVLCGAQEYYCGGTDVFLDAAYAAATGKACEPDAGKLYQLPDPTVAAVRSGPQGVRHQLFPNRTRTTSFTPSCAAKPY